MDEKITKALKFLGLGYMLFFCFAFIPYFGALIGFEGDMLITVMMVPMMAWCIFFFIFIFSRDLGHEAKYINKPNAMKLSYKIATIFCAINIVCQILAVIFATTPTPLPMILFSQDAPLSVIFAVLALFSGSMILAPYYMSQFINADVTYYVKHTTKTYLDFGYSETTTSDRFILTGQFVRMSLWTSFLSLLSALTPATIILLFALYKKSK